MENNTVLVAVYGSLRKGLGNHPCMASAKAVFIDTGIAQNFELWAYSGKNFPCVTETTDGNAEVVVEVYETTQQGLEGPLDRLEGHNPDRPEHSFYDRKQVPIILDSGNIVQAWIYYHHDEPNVQQVVHGDWKEYVNGK